MRDFFAPIEPAKIDWQGHTPRSLTYDDGYFGHRDGLAEAQSVFIEGNHLAERFSQLKDHEVFVIGETGFGTGLNVALAAQAFSAYARPQARLQMVSVDLHPLTQRDLARAIQAWPTIKPWTERLQNQYPPTAPGHHRLWLAPNIELTLMWGDAVTCYQQSSAMVDAWFLDGFSPSSNPQMWSSALFMTLYARSNPGATISSFTAAGHVRRGLAEAGFSVEKTAGFGNKRDRIVGHKPGQALSRRLHTGTALIAGAGLAGATSARALAERGWTVEVCDPNPPASGASGNKAGVIYATPSPHLQAQNRFYLNALIRALAWFHWLGFPSHPNEGRLSDVWLHLCQPRRQKNAQKAQATGAWPAELLSVDGPDLACLHGAGYIQPKAWIEKLLDHPNISYHPRKIEPGVGVEHDCLILANAQAVSDFPGLDGLSLKAIRGQVTEVQATAQSSRWEQAHCHVGYITPAIDGIHCVGATYDLHGKHPGAVQSDDEHNLDQLKQHLPHLWTELGGEKIKIIGQRSAFRCTTPDRLPICGATPTAGPKVYINTGHGSRGITHTPLCADLLADIISQSTTLGGLPMDANMADAVSPTRYLTKAAGP